MLLYVSLTTKNVYDIIVFVHKWTVINAIHAIKYIKEIIILYQSLDANNDLFILVMCMFKIIKF